MVMIKKQNLNKLIIILIVFGTSCGKYLEKTISLINAYNKISENWKVTIIVFIYCHVLVVLKTPWWPCDGIFCLIGLCLVTFIFVNICKKIINQKEIKFLKNHLIQMLICSPSIAEKCN